jgi:hypothetical protein
MLMSDTATMYRNIDVKTINIKIKYGATMEELLEYFNCSEEQFEGYVKRNFGEKGKRDIYANLEKNKKKREKKKKGLRAGVNNAKQQILIPKKVLFDDQVKRKTLTDLLEEDKVIDLPIVEQDRKMSEKSNIENMKKLLELQEIERNLVDKICEGEKELVSIRAQKRDIKARLNDEKQYMLELKKIIAEHQSNIDGIMKEISEILEKHDQLKAEIDSNSEELERVRMDIDKLKKVDILFYKNGLFELENFKYEDIPEMQLDQNIFNSLCEDETAEELSIKVIKQIVRLEQILQWFSANQLNYEITFEVEQMQKVFEKIHKN